jgi:high-affinity nickel permease
VVRLADGVTAALIWLGFLLGLRHALEPDHLTAVAALAAGGGGGRPLLRVAGAWGIGHAAVLLVAGVVLVWSGAHWPPLLMHLVEVAAGAVLVWLGIDVLWHARPPATEVGAPRFATRAFFVGGVHGVEGSGAVVLLALPAVHSTADAAVYLGAFGMGSVAGMLACSFALTLPLGLAARLFSRRVRQLQIAVAVTSIAVGAAMLFGYIRSIFT